jgi:hypothetical protein
MSGIGFGLSPASQTAMIRLLVAAAGLVFLGSIGAFFLFVPLLSIVAAVCLILGLLLMFGLGVQVGIRGSQAAEGIETQHKLDTIVSHG